MKKILLLLVFAAGLIFNQQAQAANYRINDNAVDQLFNNATESMMFDLGATANSNNATLVADEKDAIVAIALDFFFGYLGIHRFYMGTEVMSGLLYPITCGGIFGIVPLVDLIVLIINYDDISAYVNNPNFFMWKDEM